MPPATVRPARLSERFAPTVTALAAAVAPASLRVLTAPPLVSDKAEAETTLPAGRVQTERSAPTLPLSGRLSVTTLVTLSIAVMVLPAVTPRPVTYWPTTRFATSATVTVEPPTLPVVAVRVAAATSGEVSDPVAAT